jgi:transcription antitermination protein NusB
MASRRKARILAFQALYAWDAAAMPLDELLTFSWLSEGSTASADEELNAFARLMVSGTIENLVAVDASIGRHLEHWAIERLKKVDLAILRIAVYSLIFQTDIAARITIDEAIEIAKEYGAEDSYRFINGVLDAVWKELEVTR